MSREPAAIHILRIMIVISTVLLFVAGVFEILFGLSDAGLAFLVLAAASALLLSIPESRRWKRPTST